MKKIVSILLAASLSFSAYAENEVTSIIVMKTTKINFF